MRHARVFALLACLFAALLGPTAVTAAFATTGPLALDSGLVRPRRHVPDDPLAGLPSEDSGQPGPGKSAGKAVARCRLDAAPVNPRDIGDLRATLAFVQRGPKTWPCPARVAGSIRLRITVDGAGKITTVEVADGDAAAAAAMAKRLTGKAIAPRAEGSTTGTAMLTFAAGKSR
jgi:hypothetical protein